MSVSNIISAQSSSLMQLFTDSFVIPEYQRQYKWEEHDVRTVLEDVERSLHAIAYDANNARKNYRFLGSIVGVTQNRYIDTSMIDGPTAWYELVDGQQRIITFTLIIAVIYSKMIELKQEINQIVDVNLQGKYDDILNIYIEKLYNILVFRKIENNFLTRVIRYENDRWNVKYKNVSSDYVRIIRCILNKEDIKKINVDNTNMTKNVVCIMDFLNKYTRDCKTNFESEGISEDDDIAYQSSRSIDQNWIISCIENITQSVLWDAEYSVISHNFKTYKNRNIVLQNTEMIILKIVAFAYYVINRCRFIFIQTGEVDWAFDMFISLNTTGVPLNAIEIFKAHMLQQARVFPNSSYTQRLNQSIKNVYQGAHGIELYFDMEKDLTKKQRRVNEYITYLALSYEGEKLPFDLREQREWLVRTFDKHNQHEDNSTRYNQHVEYHLRLGYMTNFLIDFTKQVVSLTWVMAGASNLPSNINLNRALVSLIYIKDVNHSITQAVSSRYYELILRNQDDVSKLHHAVCEFAEVLNTMAAFYSLWKSIKGTSGLDVVYREYLEYQLSYQKVKYKLPSSRELKIYLWGKFVDALKKNMGVSTTDYVAKFEDWYSQASRSVRYSNSGMKTVCKYILFSCVHNTRTKEPGIVEEAMDGVRPFLELAKWKSDDLNTLEHVAPQTNDGNWDSNLYGPAGMWDSIGNLILFPGKANSSLSNSPWKTKWLYYRYLAAQTQENRDEIVHMAKQQGITLSDDTLKLLKEAKYAGHLDEVIAIGIDGQWDANLVEYRTKTILKIFYSRMKSILNVQEHIS